MKRENVCQGSLCDGQPRTHIIIFLHFLSLSSQPAGWEREKEKGKCVCCHLGWASSFFQRKRLYTVFGHLKCPYKRPWRPFPLRRWGDRLSMIPDELKRFQKTFQHSSSRNLRLQTGQHVKGKKSLLVQRSQQPGMRFQKKNRPGC